MSNSDKVVSREACPICQLNGGDTSGDNLTVYEDGHKYCFACGHHESADNLGGHSPSRKASRSASISRSYSIPYRTHRREEGLPLPKRDEPLNTKRTFTPEILDRYGVKMMTWVNDSDIPILDRNGREQAHAVIFPWYSLKGELQGAKYRKWKKLKNEKFAVWNEGEPELMVFGLNAIPSDATRIIVTEGETDTLSWAMLLKDDLTTAVIGIPGSEYAVKVLPRLVEFLYQFNEIYWAFDNDRASNQHRDEYLEVLPPVKTRIVTYPEGVDATELYFSYQDEVMYDILERAQIVTSEKIAAFDDVEDKMLSLVYGDDPNLNTISTRYPLLDQLIGGYSPGKVIMIAGSPKDGKTTLVNNLTRNLVKADVSVQYIPLEITAPKVLARLASIEVKENLLAPREQWKRDVPKEETKEAIAFYKQGLIFVNHFGSMYIEDLQRIVYAGVKQGARVLVFDHISAATVGMGTQELDAYMYAIKGMTEELNISSVVVSHINSLEEGKRIRYDDLRNSRSLAQVPDTILGVEADHDEKTTTVYTVLPDRDIGEMGQVVFEFSYGKLIELMGGIGYGRDSTQKSRWGKNKQTQQSQGGNRQRGLRQSVRGDFSFSPPAPKPPSQDVPSGAASGSLPTPTASKSSAKSRPTGVKPTEDSTDS